MPAVGRLWPSDDDDDDNDHGNDGGDDDNDPGDPGELLQQLDLSTPGEKRSPQKT